jgi:glutaredoxin 3
MGILGSKQVMGDTEQEVRAEIDEQIKKYKVFMISKAACPFCKTAKSILQDGQYLIPEDHMLIRDISNDPNQHLIQDYMSILTGGRTVPRVFIGGECIGGGNETASLHRSPDGATTKLGVKLKDAGAI